MPIPVSDTVTTSSSARFSARNPTRPPAGVNFKALKTRFRTIFSSLSGSASNVPNSGSMRVSSRSRLSSATCCAALARPRMNSSSSSGSRLTAIRPDSSRTRSSRSLISFNSRMPFECMVTSTSRVLSSIERSNRCSRVSSGASSSVSGVRSSWLMLAKNRLLI